MNFPHVIEIEHLYLKLTLQSQASWKMASCFAGEDEQGDELRVWVLDVPGNRVLVLDMNTPHWAIVDRERVRLDNNPVEAAHADERNPTAMEQALKDAGVEATIAHVYGASEFVAGRPTVPRWTAESIRELVRKVFDGIGEEKAEDIALYVDGQWIGELPTHQWQADLCFEYGGYLHQWASLIKAEEAAFEEAKVTSEPSIQTCACCNLVQPYTNTLCTDCGHDLCDPEGCECEACKIEHAEDVATGQSWEPETDAFMPAKPEDWKADPEREQSTTRKSRSS